MKTLLRCGYLALIVVSVANQLDRGRRGDADSDPMATLSAGLERLNIHTERSSAANILTGQSPSCRQPIYGMLLPIDGREDERLRDLRPTDEVIKYVYLGAVEEDRDGAVMIGRWVWANALFAVGLRSHRPRSNFVVVAVPRACPELATLDWTALSPGN